MDVNGAERELEVQGYDGRFGQSQAFVMKWVAAFDEVIRRMASGYPGIHLMDIPRGIRRGREHKDISHVGGLGWVLPTSSDLKTRCVNPLTAISFRITDEDFMLKYFTVSCWRTLTIRSYHCRRG